MSKQDIDTPCPQCGERTERRYSTYDLGGEPIKPDSQGRIHQRLAGRRCLKCGWSNSYESRASE